MWSKVGIEAVSNVALLETGELAVGLESRGKPSYQFVYRAGRGVYWDAARREFRSRGRVDWPSSKWFRHIVSAVKSELGVELRLGKNVSFQNVPDCEQVEIRNSDAT
mgnify:CR=1 FL=1